MVARRGWVSWFHRVRRWLATAGIYRVDAATLADLMALFERDYEPHEAAFVIADME